MQSKASMDMPFSNYKGQGESATIITDDDNISCRVERHSKMN